MDPKEAYRLEEIKLKVAETQKEANALLAEAKKAELEIEKLRCLEESKLAEIRAFLLEFDFGKHFQEILKLKDSSDIGEIIENMQFLKDRLNIYGTVMVGRFQEGKPFFLAGIGSMLMKEFIQNYNKFLALGHPGYELNIEERDYHSVREGNQLYLMSKSGSELRKYFENSFQEIEDRLIDLYKEEIKNKEE